jgi:hypothetical protein
MGIDYQEDLKHLSVSYYLMRLVSNCQAFPVMQVPAKGLRSTTVGG